MKYAPLYIPTLCRSQHFIRLVESLKKNRWAKYTEIFIGVDFPTNKKHVKGWREICSYLEEEDFSDFQDIHIFKREYNYGAAKNCQELKKEILKRFDRWIYIEDDVEVSPNFLEYMDKCLERYENDSDIIAICGYSYPILWNLSEDATCFRQQINHSAWGTGYWANKSDKRDIHIGKGTILSLLPRVIAEKKYRKMIDACLYDYINAACYKWSYGHEMMLKPTDISIRAYLATMSKYAITPSLSKVRNTGFDGSGMYCQAIADNFGNTAGTYDYSRQPIDTSSTFELIEDTKHADEENRRRLNEFDYRSPEQMSKTYRLLWLCEHIGIWSAKLYCLIGLPWDFVKRAWKKYVKK